MARRGSNRKTWPVSAGTDPALRDEYVVISAHLDHLGVGEPIDGDPFTTAPWTTPPAWRRWSNRGAVNENKTQTKRSLLFLAVTGEEKGLLGSRYFAAHPTVALSSSSRTSTWTCSCRCSRSTC